MTASRHDPAGVDAYIAGFAEPTRSRLIELRAVFRDVMPGAEEFISYRIPTFRLDDGTRLHFAGYDNHLGVYPVHELPAELDARVAPFRSGAATLRVPVDAPLDRELLANVILAQVGVQRTRRHHSA